MEVMSSLLLLALALLPQVLGLQPSNADANKMNSKKPYNERSVMKRPVWLNLNGSPLVHKSDGIHHLYKDHKCKKCYNCMEKAYAEGVHSHLSKKSSVQDRLFENAIVSHRTKRSARTSDGKNKMKKSKTKLITVTKYNLNGALHAVKVKENMNNETSTCEVYSVIKAYPCNSPEADRMLAVATVSKKKQEKTSNNKKPELQLYTMTVDYAYTTKTPTTEAFANKRAVDHSVPILHDIANDPLSFEEYF